MARKEVVPTAAWACLNWACLLLQPSPLSKAERSSDCRWVRLHVHPCQRLFKVLQTTQPWGRQNLLARRTLSFPSAAMKFELTDDALLKTHGVLATAFGLQLGLAPRASHDLFMGASAAVSVQQGALRSRSTLDPRQRQWRHRRTAATRC